MLIRFRNGRTATAIFNTDNEKLLASAKRLLKALTCLTPSKNDHLLSYTAYGENDTEVTIEIRLYWHDGFVISVPCEIMESVRNYALSVGHRLDLLA
jgi:hypothetical protein